MLLGAAKRRAVFFKSVLLLPYAIPVASIVVLCREPEKNLNTFLPKQLLGLIQLRQMVDWFDLRFD